MRPILSLLQFTTVLPMGKPQNFDCFARHSWLYPVAGYVIAFLVALPVYFISDRTLAAAIAVAGVILISGAHHFDGLLDFGDGLMAHGDYQRRIRALTDNYVGAGGIAAGLVITLLLFPVSKVQFPSFQHFLLERFVPNFPWPFLPHTGLHSKRGCTVTSISLPGPISPSYRFFCAFPLCSFR